MYGQVASAWEIKDGKFTLRVEIPANTTATVRLPKAKLEQVTENGVPLQASPGVSQAQQLEDAVSAELGSGSYVFESKY
jgi:alpha-L-rhamnosidase